MTTANLTGSDVRIRDAVMRQLDWDPLVDASAIGVTAKGGVVTLTGYTGSYSSKLAAERAAKHIRGVRAVANDVDVTLKLERTDTDIAADAARALEMHSLVPDSVKAAVHDGHITLTGPVSGLHQKLDAAEAVRHIRGIRGVHNHIVVKPGPALHDVKRRIVRALHEDADVNARNVAVTVLGSSVMLTGGVDTWRQRDAAERAAVSMPGISYVDNRIAVDPRTDNADEDLDDAY